MGYLILIQTITMTLSIFLLLHQLLVVPHHQLLVVSLQYLSSLALKPLYKIRIESALTKVSNAVPTEQTGNTVLRLLEVLSELYRDLLDKVTQCTDRTWIIPSVNSNPSSALIRINHLWQETLEQIRFDSVWDLSPY